MQELCGRYSLSQRAWFAFVLVIGSDPFSHAQTGAASPDHRWKIEITQARGADSLNGTGSTKHLRLIVHDLGGKSEQVLWDRTGDWLPAIDDSARALWRSDNEAFTLPDTARKWKGFSVYVRGGGKWAQAYQSNDFLDQIPKIWNLTNKQFNAAQVGGVVTNLGWGAGGELHFKFWSFDHTDTLITEKIIDEKSNPKVIYIGAARDKAAQPPQH